jgi:hypothetical protein
MKSGKPNLKCIVRGRREKEGTDYSSAPGNLLDEKRYKCFY